MEQMELLERIIFHPIFLSYFSTLKTLSLSRYTSRSVFITAFTTIPKVLRLCSSAVIESKTSFFFRINQVTHADLSKDRTMLFPFCSIYMRFSSNSPVMSMFSFCYDEEQPFSQKIPDTTVPPFHAPSVQLIVYTGQATLPTLLKAHFAHHNNFRSNLALEKSLATKFIYHCIDFRSFCPQTSHCKVIKLTSSPEIQK